MVDWMLATTGLAHFGAVLDVRVYSAAEERDDSRLVGIPRAAFRGDVNCCRPAADPARRQGIEAWPARTLM